MYQHPEVVIIVGMAIVAAYHIFASWLISNYLGQNDENKRYWFYMTFIMNGLVIFLILANLDVVRKLLFRKKVILALAWLGYPVSIFSLISILDGLAGG
jgi:hypothetical protein